MVDPIADTDMQHLGEYIPKVVRSIITEAAHENGEDKGFNALSR